MGSKLKTIAQIKVWWVRRRKSRLKNCLEQKNWSTFQKPAEMRNSHGGENLIQLCVDGVVHQPVEALPENGSESETELKGGLRHAEHCG